MDSWGERKFSGVKKKLNGQKKKEKTPKFPETAITLRGEGIVALGRKGKGMEKKTVRGGGRQATKPHIGHN